MSKRPISVSHLVFGLVFLGAAVLWAIGAATDADTPDLALVAPAVLIAAGVAGLVAIVLNARNARIAADATAVDSAVDSGRETGPTTDPEYADTGVHHPEENS